MKTVIFSEETYESVLICMKYELDREKDLRRMGAKDMDASIEILNNAVAEIEKAQEEVE